MSEQYDSTEDLQLEASEAEAVVGGHVSPGQFEAEIRKLESEGYIEESCIVGGTVMYNPKTKQRKTVKV